MKRFFSSAAEQNSCRDFFLFRVRSLIRGSGTSGALYTATPAPGTLPPRKGETELFASVITSAAPYFSYYPGRWGGGCPESKSGVNPFISLWRNGFDHGRFSLFPLEKYSYFIRVMAEFDFPRCFEIPVLDLTEQFLRRNSGNAHFVTCHP